MQSSRTSELWRRENSLTDLYRQEVLATLGTIQNTVNHLRIYVSTVDQDLEEGSNPTATLTFTEVIQFYNQYKGSYNQLCLTRDAYISHLSIEPSEDCHSLAIAFLAFGTVLTTVAIGWTIGTLLEHHSKDSKVKSFIGMIVLWGLVSLCCSLPACMSSLYSLTERAGRRAEYAQFTQRIEAVDQIVTRELLQAVEKLVQNNQMPSQQDIESVTQDDTFSPAIKTAILRAAGQEQEPEFPTSFSFSACCSRLFSFNNPASAVEELQLVVLN